MSEAEVVVYDPEVPDAYRYLLADAVGFTWTKLPERASRWESLELAREAVWGTLRSDQIERLQAEPAPPRKERADG